ncbi:glycosyltransferase family 2 protein [Sutcliffiella horikoshii]|uniref:teichuronic acid biosynthesis protein TuaG n=1 Tax=Sutcliffiella horikoshii TaxID=79883 RepID=UPI001CC1694B|nr:glycosyltransferase family 2 protein [Sutcliffiella horikoshii]UAL47047.1 glycosyltransferase family 2 protein [Sutcliffiella horikoshii]
MSSSLVSVITPSYNAEKFISATIESVRTQTYTNWEMIIVDDCSKDTTREILKKYAELDPRIKPIFLEENSGAAVARNTALKAAQGDYVAFLDSDDLWVLDKLEKQLAFMQENDYAFSFTAYNLMDENGKPLDKVIDVPEQIDYKGLLKNTIIGCLTVMIDTRKVEPLQMPLIRTRQDFALWLKVLREGHIAYGMQEPLANYRIVEGSISSNKLKTAKRNWYVYREIEKLSLPYASWCFINYAFYAIKKRVQA